ncbi:MAG: peroxiredoxin, partial [Planctomycetes bacterium]|nr:peroxiredoxin [Planctomycetota bacterium]
GRRVVRYQGRIDDQYGVNGRRPQPERSDLRCALEDLLAGKPVTVPVTRATGCALDRLDLSASGAVTYNRDVAPILQNHCVVCHRPGQIAPFALTNYRDAARKARTIREAVEAERMPPWHADPRYGQFANDGRLTDADKQTLYDWIDGGLAEGKPADLPPARQFTEGWNIPQPDVVISMPRPFTVPAQGVIDYQWFEVDPGFQEDTWIQAAEIRPGNRKVVHHANVFLRAPGTDGVTLEGELGNYFLAGTAPGTPPLILPPGMAKLVPAGYHLVFVVHYAAIGTEQTDQTSIGLVLADPKTVKKEVATNLLFDENLAIPPRTPDFRVERTQTFSKDVLLLAMFPHMHLRGKSFRYEAVYPDGSTEVLLDVPRYDFNWQNRYVLAEPKRLPAGTTLRCIAHYDNSSANPNNPDPNATVHAGRQSWDEMFNGYVEIALADQDLTQPKPWSVTWRAWVQKALQPRVAIGPLLLCGGLLVGRRFLGKKRGQSAA